MVAVQVAAGFPAVTALGKRPSWTVIGGLKGRKPLRVSCQQSVLEDQSGGGQQEAVDILQSSRNPLLNLPREDLMAALGERGAGDGAAADPVGDPSLSSSAQRRRVERVKFTAEKARLLRKENRATQTFHDKWYHSAIASKLAMPE